MSIQEKYHERIEALKAVPEDLTELHVSLVVKNIIASLISPMRPNVRMFDTFMEFLAQEFDAMGYSLTKNEVVVGPEDGEDNEEKAKDE